jgi:hypothetical protein
MRYSVRASKIGRNLDRIALPIEKALGKIRLSVKKGMAISVGLALAVAIQSESLTAEPSLEVISDRGNLTLRWQTPETGNSLRAYQLERSVDLETWIAFRAACSH